MKKNPGLNRDSVPLPPSVPVANSVVMKLPVFWPNASEIWFAQAEAQLAIKTVTVSKTKFYHTVANLPQDVAAQILDLIRAPLACNPYNWYYFVFSHRLP